MGGATEGQETWRYQPALDGLRALAVLAVIAYHDRYSWAKGGFLGVDTFFVLSGFLITTLLVREWERRDHIELLAFWGRRLRRLLPALLLVLITIAVVAWLVEPTVQLGRIRSDGIASVFYVANWHFVRSSQSYFDLVAAPSPLRHMWSLAIEEQFYLVWPLVVMACLRVGRGSLRILAAVCVIGTMVSVALMALLYQSADPSRAYFGTDSRAHTILVGCILALVVYRFGPTLRRAAGALQGLSILAGLGIVWAWTSVSDITPWYYRGGSLVYAIAVTVVIAAAIQPARVPMRSLLSPGPLRWIGRISYGLYLWHWPATVYLTSARTGLDGNALNLVRLGVTFAAATASFYLVERPVRQGALGRLRLRVRFTAPAAMAMTCVVLLVATMAATAPPSSLAGGAKGGMPSACPNPRPDELQAARTAIQARATDTSVVTGSSPLRIMLVGDSWACSLLVGLDAIAPTQHLEVSNGATLGCGVVADAVAPLNGFPTAAFANACHPLTRRVEAEAARRLPPDLVLWYSGWETFDLLVDGRDVAFDSPEGEALLLGRMEAAFQRLTRNGAHLAILTAVPRPQSQTLPPSTATDTARRDRLNTIEEKFAARHPGRVTVIDQSALLCPSGPECPETIDGVTPRPFDGTHFDTAGAALVAGWLVPRLHALPRATAP